MGRIMLEQGLIGASAGICLLAGILHLYSSFFGPDLRPADAGLEARMREVPMNVSSRTTMWGAWVAFNAILGLGLMLFGMLYGYLALLRFPLLQQAPFLLLLGSGFLATLVEVWRRYTYHVPTLVFAIAFALFTTGAAMAA